MYHDNRIGVVSSGHASMGQGLGTERRARRRFEDSMSYALFTTAYAQLLERVIAAGKRAGVAPLTAEPDGARCDAEWVALARTRGYTETEIEDLQELLRVRLYVTHDNGVATFPADSPAEGDRTEWTASSVYHAMREAGVPTVVLGSDEHRRWVARHVRRAARGRRVGLGLLALGSWVLAMSLGGADGGLASLVLGCTAVAGGLLLVR